MDHSIALHFMKLINVNLRVCSKVLTLVREFAPFAAVRQRHSCCEFDFNHRTPQECMGKASGAGKTVVEYTPYA
ncbi:MAG: hypothetical protein RLZZ61_283 [Pseudomonadota bacterium]|jgi:hypothetical protein